MRFDYYSKLFIFIFKSVPSCSYFGNHLVVPQYTHIEFQHNLAILLVPKRNERVVHIKTCKQNSTIYNSSPSKN